MGDDVQPCGIQVRDDVGARLALFIVGMARGNTRPGLDKHLQAQSCELPDRLGGRGDPPFAFPALPRYAQLHPPRPSNGCSGAVTPLGSLSGGSRSGAAARSWLESMAPGRRGGG